MWLSHFYVGINDCFSNNAFEFLVRIESGVTRWLEDSSFVWRAGKHYSFDKKSMPFLIAQVGGSRVSSIGMS